VYRIGGDEFLVILEGSHAELPPKLASLHGDHEEFSISAGSAVYNRGTDSDYRGVFSRADTAMYNDKREYYQTHGERRRAPRNEPGQ
jgi:GGDEF domain-containing protein